MARAITVDLSTGKAQLVHRATRPHPGPGQLLVRMLVRPVHPLDVILIKNPSVIPEILNSHGKTLISGCEGFGCVEEIGEGITHFKPGQRVVPLECRGGPQYGTWQDYMVVDEKKVIAVPDSVSDEAAAQFIVNPWTVYGLLETLAVPKSEYIIQTAAGSVLGRQLIQLAKHQGIKTINIIRRDEWKHELKALGADEVINSKTEDVVARVKEITRGKLAYGAVDAVGGILTKNVAASVRDDGKVLVYGNLSGEDYMQSILDLRRGVEFRWWTFYKHVTSEEKERQVATEVMKLLEEKIITPLAGKKFKLEDFKEAIEESEKERRSGKVLLVS